MALAPHQLQASTSGETVYLSDAQSRLVDSLVVSDVPAYGSVGRSPVGGARVFYEVPTPAAPNGNAGFTARVDGKVTFSRGGGRTEPFSLALSSVSGAAIRYTLDGSAPTAASRLYEGPVSIDATTVVRARVFGAPNEQPSNAQTEVYLVGIDHAIDVASLTIAPEDLYDPDNGIYVLGRGYEGSPPYRRSNLFSGREVPVHFGFYPLAGYAPTPLTFDGTTRLFGGYSRSFPQKSFAVFAREPYGTETIEYPLFPNRDYTEFSSFVLRNSGNDWQYTYLRDVTFTGLMAGSGLDYADFRAVATYLNGEYWGLYNIREKLNEDFLATRHGLDADEITILEGRAEVVEGSNEDYTALIDYVAATDLTSDAAFARVAAEIDLDNYATYQAAEIYIDNRDWPGTNVKFWRAPGRKWQWILYDTDFGALLFQQESFRVNTLAHALEAEGTNYANVPWATLLFRRLVSNEGFRNRFVNQMADQINSRFLPDSAIALINANAERIAPEIAQAEQRWNGTRDWAAEVEQIREFFRERPENVRRHVLDQFDLPAMWPIKLTIADTTEGSLQINSLSIDEPSWTGIYYESVPVTLTAFAKTGYVFSHWRHDPTLTDTTLIVNLNAAQSFEPVFSIEPTSTVTSAGQAATTLLVDVHLGPNPTAGELVVTLDVRQRTSVKLTLTDRLGRIVEQRTLGELAVGQERVSLDLSALAPGSYRIEVADGQGGRQAFAIMKS